MIDTTTALDTPATRADLTARLAAARSRLVRLARLRGVPADQAEDIAQEALLTGWRALDRLREPQRFDAWLDGIARNLCRRRARALDGAAASLDTLDTLDTLDAFDPHTGEPDPLDDLTRQELAVLIDAALGHLRETLRAALELRYLADLPAAEVAARLGVSLNTLDARLSRARRQVRDILNGPLRERAIEFGLALGPADESGWRDSRIWCPFCGQASMRGILENAPNGGGRMMLRCPRCYQASGATETAIDSMAIIQGLTSFRAATKRLRTLAAERIAPALRRPAPCFTCGASVSARVVTSEQAPEAAAFAASYPGRYFVITRCPRCGGGLNGAVGIAGATHPDIARFMLQSRRMVVEPEELTTYESTPAIRFSLRDLASGARMVYYADPQTLDLRGVYPS